jgi:glycosyltransferase involved in cell wall biosynthesis
MHNIHISLTEFRNESRVLKEVSSLLQRDVFSSVTIFALHSEGLAELEELSVNFKLFRIRINSRGLPSLIPFQLLKYVEFAVRVILQVLRQTPKVINVHSLALLPIGVLLKFLFRAKLVYDAHELETEVEGLNGLRQRLSRLVELICIPAVDLVITVGPMICDWYRKRYQINNVVAVLNCPPLKQVARRGRLREELGIGPQKIICLYQGALCSGRGIELLLDTFENSGDDSVVFVCMGYGELEDTIKSIAARCSRIYYFPAVPPSVVLDYTVDADIGFALIENTCLSYYLCLPNKLFEYAMAGVPLVCSPVPEMASLVQNYKIGALIEDASPAGVMRAVQAVNSLDRVQLKLSFNNFNSSFRWEEQEKVMIEAYQIFVLNRV